MNVGETIGKKELAKELEITLDELIKRLNEPHIADLFLDRGGSIEVFRP